MRTSSESLCLMCQKSPRTRSGTLRVLLLGVGVVLLGGTRLRQIGARRVARFRRFGNFGGRFALMCELLDEIGPRRIVEVRRELLYAIQDVRGAEVRESAFHVEEPDGARAPFLEHLQAEPHHAPRDR